MTTRRDDVRNEALRFGAPVLTPEVVAEMIAAAVEIGLTWTPQFRCGINSTIGKVCRMNEGHAGTHRSADGGEW